MDVPLLAVQEIDTFYGEVQVLRGLSLDVHAGETVCLLGLAVERNLAMALYGARPAAVDGKRWTVARVYERFPILGRLRGRAGGHLSGGEAQLVAIARALLMHPRLVLLDEASQGLAPRIVEEIMAVIQEMREEGIAILLVEQNSSLALGIADRAYVIDDGRIVHASGAAELEADTALKHRLLAV